MLHRHVATVTKNGQSKHWIEKVYLSCFALARDGFTLKPLGASLSAARAPVQAPRFTDESAQFQQRARHAGVHTYTASDDEIYITWIPANHRAVADAESIITAFSPRSLPSTGSWLLAGCHCK